MPHRFADIAFTSKVKELQAEFGSRTNYARLETEPSIRNDRLGAHEAEFIAERDSFYMATVSETGWPYVQHRGGPRGFVRALADTTIGFADYRGNRQYVSVGNLATNDRVSLFFMDYARKRRLKLFGHVRIATTNDAEAIAQLQSPGVTARVERGFIISVAAFDWNCPQHITERYTVADVRNATGELTAPIAQLELELARKNASERGA